MKCCSKADARKITCQEHDDARDVARAIRKTEQYKVSSEPRKKVEMLFAHLKRLRGLIDRWSPVAHAIQLSLWIHTVNPVS